MGRSFDVDDIILNTIGSIIGTYLAIYISKNNIKKIPSTLR
ncbi:VanZ family protein [Bacillus thuringiensis]|nr:VanZ family protein [Bacillus thuringiensis]